MMPYAEISSNTRKRNAMTMSFRRQNIAYIPTIRLTPMVAKQVGCISMERWLSPWGSSSVMTVMDDG